MKKLLLNTLIGLALLTCQTSFAQKTKAKFSPIKVETPARPANQQDPPCVPFRAGTPSKSQIYKAEHYLRTHNTH